MITLPESEFRNLKQIAAQMETDYAPWRAFHSDLAQFILPTRYRWLVENPSGGELVQPKINSVRNGKILDSYGTKAARTLAAGMLNGVASPARQWFSVRVPGFDNDFNIELRRWEEEVLRRMLFVLAESNFYNSLALLLLELNVFGTAGMLCYEDYDDVVRFYNLPLGEFKIAQDYRRDVNRMSRCFTMTVAQLVPRFGEENVLPSTREKYKRNDSSLLHGITVYHIIEPNTKDSRFVPGGYKFREFYFEVGVNAKNQLLERAVYHERPGAFPRWEILGNDPYGVSPGMDALGDIIQLQQETIRKGEAIDKMTDPPVVLDATLRNQQGSSHAGGRYYAPSYSTVGGRALYEVRMPLAELSQDIRDVQTRIGDAFFNDLFRMISQLQTVRSATEIDARREEKLILMGAVLERLENEALDPIMSRVFGIMQRKGLIPPLPEGVESAAVQIEYVSILSEAQRASGTGVIERFMQVVGNTIAVDPSVRFTVNWTEILRDYAMRLSVPSAGINSPEVAAQLQQKEQELVQAQQQAQVGQTLTQSAKNLSAVDVGGGQNAVESLLGGL